MQIAMQIAAMNPIAIDEDGVSEEVKQKEIEVAIEKTKAEQVQKDRKSTRLNSSHANISYAVFFDLYDILFVVDIQCRAFYMHLHLLHHLFLIVQYRCV